jgi:hypothetical protein
MREYSAFDSLPFRTALTVKDFGDNNVLSLENIDI